MFLEASGGSLARQILIAEDSRFQRKTLARQLREWGYDVLEAKDGAEGLNMYLDHFPRIIATDLHMPRMDGRKLVRAVREAEVSYTYILVISGMQDKDSIVSALSAGSDDYIIKPFHPGELEVRLSAAERVLRLQSQDMLIFSLAQLADYRSPETGNHLHRVQAFSRLLAEELSQDYPELNKSMIELVAVMSCLHDIGKVGVPDDILNKQGKLSRLEYGIIKKHSLIGGTLLDDVYQKTKSEQLRVAKEIVMHHHERWDGEGYPDMLKGEEIPLAARIVALADVYDALCNERCYKPAFDREQAESIILSERGKHFDPKVVDAFWRRRDDFYSILLSYTEDPALV